VWVVVDRLAGMDGLPNRVPFTAMLEHYPIVDIEKAPLILGVGKHRQIQTVYLADHPHVLIAGSSGGGKSNMVNNIISQLMWFIEPDAIKFTLIDLKRMEFGLYTGSPHLSGPVIFTAEDAIKALDELIVEVLRRADLLSGKAKELSVWNKRFPDQRMPRLVVVIDEFAELMLASGSKTAKIIEDSVTRLVNLGRAVGVHAIICTQRPAVSVLPNSIKINMPLIISGRVQSGAQSKVIVDNDDAASLPLDPKGRMLYLSGSARQEIQTPFIDDDEVKTAVRIANGRAAKVIRLSGYDPVIVPEKLTEWINANAFGWLNGATAAKLRDFAITAAMFKTYGDELTAAGQTKKFSKVWRIKQPKWVEPPAVAVQAAPVEIEPPTLEAAANEVAPPVIVLTANQIKVLEVLIREPSGMTFTPIVNATSIAKSSLNLVFKQLIKKGFVIKDGDKFVVTDAGRSQFTLAAPVTAQNPPPETIPINADPEHEQYERPDDHEDLDMNESEDLLENEMNMTSQYEQMESEAI
jgi:predicted transcriptional regulator